MEPLMDNLPFPETGLVRLPQVLTALPISKSGWYEGIADGKYPRPIKLGRISLWRAEDIHALIEKITLASAQ